MQNVKFLTIVNKYFMSGLFHQAVVFLFSKKGNNLYLA